MNDMEYMAMQIELQIKLASEPEPDIYILKYFGEIRSIIENIKIELNAYIPDKKGNYFMARHLLNKANIEYKKIHAGLKSIKYNIIPNTTIFHEYVKDIIALRVFVCSVKKTMDAIIF